VPHALFLYYQRSTKTIFWSLVDIIKIKFNIFSELALVKNRNDKKQYL